MAARPLLLGFASESGNAETLAKHLASLLLEQGWPESELICLALDELTQTLATNTLPANAPLIIVTSTYGAGDIPFNGAAFFAELRAARLQVNGRPYAILALGDRAYETFCEAGHKLERLLTEQGAQAIQPLKEADTQYQPIYNQWVSELLPNLGLDVPEHLLAFQQTYSAKAPYQARLKHQHRLTRPGADKDVRHYVLDIEGSGIAYRSGDSMGLMPENDSRRVQDILELAGLSGNEWLDRGEAAGPVRLMLQRHIELTTPGQGLLEWLANETQEPWLLGLLQPTQFQAFCQFQFKEDLADVLRRFADKVPPLEILARQSELLPRYYSLSASPAAHPNELHLTVATLEYEKHERRVTGTASGMLAQSRPGDRFGIFLQPSPLFSLPENPDTDIIMIGPGTGIAPFRAFLQERQLRRGKGRNWLFFGERHRQTHFLYEADLLRWQVMGVLDRLDLAFSRDQDSPIYVQHRMLEQARTFYEWLENGAVIYLCGDKSRMAVDVDRALRQVLIEGGGLDQAEAGKYLLQMRMQKRYLRDVY
ncbi:sulfite reductase flavoprotein subunit alpha [Pokkaliibacter sp. CJK22405]|uniref:diflavin oxidoreductase n=1 Tax=Pokkaliibacter sp. CJK22405 TaxID=3384615 RepID=UPI003984AC55